MSQKVRKYIRKQINEIFESTNFMYHITRKENKDQILGSGLMVNMPYGMTEGGSWAREVYGINPIFLSLNPSKTAAQDLIDEDFNVIIEVDVTGLKLIADLPSLVDKGAYIDDGLRFLYWKEGAEPYEISEFLDENGEIRMNDLIDSDFHGMESIIEFTGSAAVVKDIPPDKLKAI